MAKIIWTATALSDLDSIAEYISADSVFYAKQFVQKILLAADKLEKHPELGKVVPELPSIITGKYFLSDIELFIVARLILFTLSVFITPPGY